jgi:cell shape-determining protein MreC
MLTRISLIVAILASIGSLLVSHLKLSEKITGLESSLATTTQQLGQTRTELSQTETELQEKTDELDRNQRQLEQTEQQLADMRTRAQQQQARADRAERDLNETRTELTANQRELAAWKALGIPSDEVRNRLQDLINVNNAFAALQDENGILLRQVNDLDSRLQDLIGVEEPPPPAMPGVKGRVVAVDPKWEFVVLDVGGRQGALKRGEMLINREGKLVAKVRITRVEPDYCFANVLSDWKQADVVVGDEALGDPAM